MNKTVGFFIFFCISILSTCLAGDFQKNTQLIDTLKTNHVRLVILCNFQGTNNVLDIVTASRSPGYELTNYGLATLQDTIPVLAPLNISNIYTAPAFRAQQSANLIGKALELDPSELILDARLGMQNFGSAEGDDYDIYKRRFQDEQDMLENTPPNGESGLSVFKRMQEFLVSLENKDDQTILVITHAFNFCHISKCLTGKYGPIPSPGTFVIYHFE